MAAARVGRLRACVMVVVVVSTVESPRCFCRVWPRFRMHQCAWDRSSMLNLYVIYIFPRYDVLVPRLSRSHSTKHP